MATEGQAGALEREHSQQIPDVSLKVEFGGGLELLFSNQRSHRINIPSKVSSRSLAATERPTEATEGDALKPVDITYLIYYLRDNLLKERAELFMENGTMYVVLSLSSGPMRLNALIKSTRHTRSR